MKNEYKGSILQVREAEDCIRKTNKYTKGAFKAPVKHPIQGEDFPSRVLTEYYEVYPDTEISWNMPAGVAIDWLWGETTHIDVVFRYDYRDNKAKMTVHGDDTAVKELEAGIPGLSVSISNLSKNGHND